MSPEDCARAAERLLDDPLVTKLLTNIELDAIEAMLEASTDEDRRFARDTVKAIRALRNGLHYQVAAAQETKRLRPDLP